MGPVPDASTDQRLDPTLAGVSRDGLSSHEAEARRRQDGGRGDAPAGRGYRAIVRTNVFNLYNTILFVIGATLLALGQYSDAFISAAIGLLNAVISAVQEIRSKRQLERLQQQERRPVLVRRDGRDTEVRSEEVVRGDVVLVRPGDQLVSDGPLLEGGVEVDESLLTGQPDVRWREPGDVLLSGSRCVSGGGLQLAREVGAASHARRLAGTAGRHPSETTRLQRQIAFCVRLVMVLVILMSGAILLETVLEGLSLVRVVQTTAVLSGLVPYGLFFLIVAAYTAGAVTSARRGALVQQVNAVESLSEVDVVCLDKTGTLTTGHLVVTDVTPLGVQHGLADGSRVDDSEQLGNEALIRAALGSMARSTRSTNPTSSALATQLPGETVPAIEEVPFGSALRWSGVRTAAATWVLGAPEALSAALPGEDLSAEVAVRAAAGSRVLLFARAVEPGAALRGADGRPLLPTLEPLALVTLADQLRPDVPATLARFADDHIDVLVVSGDDPATVAALARRAGLAVAEPVDATRLVQLGDAELDAVVAGGVVFGRADPEQKERIVRSLRRQGHHVAMVGDGVNDARALAAAQVGVAMRSGSAVTRDVADIVLVEDSLSALLPARREGRRIISGIAVSAQVFLTRVATQALVIVTVTMLGLGFPYSPAQTGLTLFTVGLPTVFLAAWARPRTPDPQLLVTLARFVLPAAVVTAGFGVAIYAFLYTVVTHGFDDPEMRTRLIAEFQAYTGLTYGVDADFTEAAATIGAQTGLSTFVSLASILLILFLEPPSRLFAAWTRTSPDRRPAVLVVALLAGLLTALVVPTFRDYFGLTRPAGVVYATVVPMLLLWFLALTAAFRLRLMDRLLGLRELLER